MSGVVHSAWRTTRRWLMCLAALLALLHAAPTIACASEGSSSGCCDECAPRSCHLVADGVCSAGHATCDVARQNASTLSAHREDSGSGADGCDAFSYPSLLEGLAPPVLASTPLAPSSLVASKPIYLQLLRLRL